MWTEDDLYSINGDQVQVLESILMPSCATPELVCMAAERLETLDSSCVCCFAKLPFPLAVNSSDTFSISTGRDRATAQLRFSHYSITDDQSEGVTYSDCPLIPNSNSKGVGTQVVALISLWGRHLRYYQNYRASLTPSGLEKRLLNTSLWGKRRAPAGYDGDPIDSQGYESELAQSAAIALRFALRIFIDNYNIVALARIIHEGRARGVGSARLQRGGS